MPDSGSKRDACTTFLEELINACVLELYFPDEAKTKNLLFIDQVRELVDEVIDPTTVGRVTPPAVSDIETFVAIGNADLLNCAKTGLLCSRPQPPCGKAVLQVRL